MNKSVIKINNLSKEYRLGTIGYGTLKEDLNSWWASVQNKPDPNSIINIENRKINQHLDHILALDKVNLKVKKGERLGIIGKNGAGKTTLLKILSRIASPTKGSAKIRGRVASLIAVGTGFHKELTGRENIYLNGAILGLSKKEIDNSFEEIVDFSGVKQFIDTPVKRYSSGMYIRLGFAVAAHLNPDILIVDEVLAVGDAEFRNKAIGKMKNVSEREGRTVFFVSHNMAAIQELCNRAILLENGKIIADGLPKDVIKEYLIAGVDLIGEYNWPILEDAPGNNIARLKAVRITDDLNKIKTNFDVRDLIIIDIHYWILENVNWLDVSIYLYNQRGELVFASFDDTTDSPSGLRKRLKGIHQSICVIPSDLLNDGEYFLQVSLTDERVVHTIERDILKFSVNDQLDPSGVRGNYKDPWPPASVRPRLNWKSQIIKAELKGDD